MHHDERNEISLASPSWGVGGVIVGIIFLAQAFLYAWLAFDKGIKLPDLFILLALGLPGLTLAGGWRKLILGKNGIWERKRRFFLVKQTAVYDVSQYTDISVQPQSYLSTGTDGSFSKSERICEITLVSRTGQDDIDVSRYVSFHPSKDKAKCRQFVADLAQLLDKKVTGDRQLGAGI